MGMKGGGANLIYLAKRAANSPAEMDQMTKMMELNRMKAMNPQLYMLVMQIVRSDQGGRADPMNPMQSPPSQQKPERRAAHVSGRNVTYASYIAELKKKSSGLRWEEYGSGKATRSYRSHRRKRVLEQSSHQGSMVMSPRAYLPFHHMDTYSELPPEWA
jgi:hypothetical protein